MTALLQFLKGYLVIHVSGFSPERFMNLCCNNGILIWNIHRENGAYEMCILLKSFYKLRPIVRKTGTKVVIRQRVGLPFLLPKLRKRKVFLFGLLLTVFIAVVSSMYVWSIELSGNHQITDDVMYSFLEEKGVRISTAKRKVDLETLEKEIRKSFPQITWVCARISGTRLLIDVKENEMPSYSREDSKEPGLDLVSEYSGKIVKMIVRNGVPKVKIGDEVEENTILVEGKVPVFNEDGTVREYSYVNGDADIYLEHLIWYEEELSMVYREKRYTGREKKIKYLRFFDFTPGLTKSQSFLSFDSLVDERSPSVFTTFRFPLWFGTQTDREYMIFEARYTSEEAKKILSKKCVDFLESLSEKGVQIIEKNVKIEENKLSMRISGDIKVWEKVERKLPTRKSPDALISQ
ncbi:MAG: sporulation protein YqfD [Acetatifactor sp.]